MDESLLELIHTCSNLIMIGIIWIVQLVHYPSFYYVSEERFPEFGGFHARRISLIVAPVMLLELGSLAYLNIYNGFSEYTLLTALGLLIIIWLVTFFISIPCHNILGTTKSLPVISKLVRTNWIRTVLWTLKGLLIILYQNSILILGY